MATLLAFRNPISACLVRAATNLLAETMGRSSNSALSIISSNLSHEHQKLIRRLESGYSKSSPNFSGGSGGGGGGHLLKRTIDRSREYPDNDAACSVIAYNLSDELKIDNIQRFLKGFDDYQIDYCLPKDVQEEAVMLRRRRTDASSVNDVFLFREGSIVFWGVPYDQQKRMLYGLSSLKVNPNASDLIQEEREHMIFKLSDTIERSRLTRDIIQIAAKQDESSMKLDQFAFSHAVALSVKLGIWEMNLDEYIESVKWITEDMKDGKDITLSKDQVFRKTGQILCLKHSINLRSDLLDLPDLYWDRGAQEDMFSAMFAYLNIRKRTNVMNEKLNNCCELMTLLASHMNDSHHIRLEWMIIFLITVEVLFEIAKFL
uniref:Required for meiotic nuclear division protein 1 n=1 Tax=Aceria tosichella TaxID=561515 RepID=A0A6G1SNU0_9ACAR